MILFFNLFHPSFLVLQVIVKHHKTERSAGTLSFLIPADSILEELLIVYIEKVHLHKCGRAEEGKGKEKKRKGGGKEKRHKSGRVCIHNPSTPHS